VVSRVARGLGEPVGGFLRLSIGDLSFTEIFGMFFIGYALGLLVSDPQGGTTSARRPPNVPIPAGRFRVGLNPFAGGGTPLAAGTAFAFLTVLIRADVFGRLMNPRPETSKSISAVVGVEAVCTNAIPAGGIGHISFHDANGRLTGSVASADVDIPRGTRVRIIGTRGLNPLVAPEPAGASARA